MASTLLEQTRGLHEEMERMERVIVKDYKQETRSHKEKLVQSHRVRRRLDQIQQAASKLVSLYEDEDEARKEEIAALGGDDIYGKFYDRLKEIREYHKRFPDSEITEAESDEALLKEEPVVEFTGEEGLGRYVDMHELWMKFVNTKFGRGEEGKQPDYYAYLDSFAQFEAIPRHLKLARAYREYLLQLKAYLVSFYSRTQPLTNISRQLQTLEEEFSAKWEAGQVPGWETRAMLEGAEPAESSALDVEAFESVDDLETVGADRLKEALAAMGLKCGGTPRQRAERLFATRGLSSDQLDSKLFPAGRAKANGGPNAGAGQPGGDAAATGAKKARAEAGTRSVALLEAEVVRLAEVLAPVIAETKARIEKKQAQTFEEMEAEREEAEAELAEEPDSDDEEFVYNPLKLPLGWDGKPIPYWLYKLHGLNQEFKCEICGNYSYWGRRAFEKHFKEWRHQNGMRALGIPNTKMFYEVTKIDDSLALWKAIQERHKGGFNAETDEELEDAAGNVYNKKTYEDLRRQGLI